MPFVLKTIVDRRPEKINDRYSFYIDSASTYSETQLKKLAVALQSLVLQKKLKHTLEHVRVLRVYNGKNQPNTYAFIVEHQGVTQVFTGVTIPDEINLSFMDVLSSPHFFPENNLDLSLIDAGINKKLFTTPLTPTKMILPSTHLSHLNPEEEKRKLFATYYNDIIDPLNQSALRLEQLESLHIINRATLTNLENNHKLIKDENETLEDNQILWENYLSQLREANEKINSVEEKERLLKNKLQELAKSGHEELDINYQTYKQKSQANGHTRAQVIHALQITAIEYFEFISKPLSRNKINEFNQKFQNIAEIRLIDATQTMQEPHLHFFPLSDYSFKDISDCVNETITTIYSKKPYLKKSNAWECLKKNLKPLTASEDIQLENVGPAGLFFAWKEEFLSSDTLTFYCSDFLKSHVPAIVSNIDNQKAMAESMGQLLSSLDKEINALSESLAQQRREKTESLQWLEKSASTMQNRITAMEAIYQEAAQTIIKAKSIANELGLTHPGLDTQFATLSRLIEKMRKTSIYINNNKKDSHASLSEIKQARIDATRIENILNKRIDDLKDKNNSILAENARLSDILLAKQQEKKIAHDEQTHQSITIDIAGKIIALLSEEMLPFWNTKVSLWGGDSVPMDNGKLIRVPKGIAEMINEIPENTSYDESQLFLKSIKVIAEKAIGRGSSRFCYQVRDPFVKLVYEMVKEIDLYHPNARRLDSLCRNLKKQPSFSALPVKDTKRDPLLEQRINNQVSLRVG